MQASPSSQLASLGTKTHPVAGAQASSVQPFPSSHGLGGPGVHSPPEQRSARVQASPSSQLASLGTKTHPVAGAQVSSVQALSSSHPAAQGFSASGSGSASGSVCASFGSSPVSRPSDASGSAFASASGSVCASSGSSPVSRPSDASGGLASPAARASVGAAASATGPRSAVASAGLALSETSASSASGVSASSPSVDSAVGLVQPTATSATTPNAAPIRIQDASDIGRTHWCPAPAPRPEFPAQPPGGHPRSGHDPPRVFSTRGGGGRHSHSQEIPVSESGRATGSWTAVEALAAAAAGRHLPDSPRDDPDVATPRSRGSGIGRR